MTDYIDEARCISAQCWCDPQTAGVGMDESLCEAFAKRLASWMEIAAQHARNEEYYRGLLVKCGEFIGEDAYTSDDGSVQQDVLCAKIPELVESLVLMAGG